MTVFSPSNSATYALAPGLQRCRQVEFAIDHRVAAGVGVGEVDRDVLSSADWGRRLAGQAADGDYVELASAHLSWDIRPRGGSRSSAVAVTMSARPDAVMRRPG